MNSLDFDEQFGAVALKLGGSAFHAFSEDNIRSIEYNPDLLIVLGADFNVNPMCWVLGHFVDVDGKPGLGIFDKIFLRNTNTPATLKYLAERRGSHKSGWIIFGDASGKARKTSATRSDIRHIQNCQELTAKRLMFSRSNPRIMDRLSSCNDLMKNATGQTRLIIDPSCKMLIADIRARTFAQEHSKRTATNSMTVQTLGISPMRWATSSIRSFQLRFRFRKASQQSGWCRETDSIRIFDKKKRGYYQV